MESKVSPTTLVTVSKSTPQYFYTKGLKIFEAAGYDATKQELDENLICRGCVEMLSVNEIDNAIKKKVLNYFLFLKRKQYERSKLEDVLIGDHKENIFLRMNQVSPTVSNYALMCSFLMSVIERRHVHV